VEATTSGAPMGQLDPSPFTWSTFVPVPAVATSFVHVGAPTPRHHHGSPPAPPQRQRPCGPGSAGTPAPLGRGWCYRKLARLLGLGSRVISAFWENCCAKTRDKPPSTIAKAA